MNETDSVAELDETELPFSPASRASAWAEVDRDHFDLLVVGAGITGAGIALDAAGRGLRVALVDAGDIGNGTSSRSSRLIHGGLRYLETLDLRLVFEALAERRRLLRLAPHLVHPLPFLFPVFRGAGVGRLKLGAGMWLYDSLALFRGVRRHQMLDRDGALQREPRLQPTDLRGGAVYFDAQVDDARLTLAVARAAQRTGAVVLPHARVLSFTQGAAGMIAGVRLRDALGGEEKDVRARLVLAATGPWLDETRRLADPDAPARLRTTKGVHIVVNRERIGNEGAIIFRSRIDDRVMFVLPWGDLTYIGTTDTDFRGDPAEPGTDAADVDYLLASANALFPDARLGTEDVIGSWSGVRPLLAPRSAKRSITPGRTSREHEIWREPNGLFCVAGGKLTTYRSMAAEAAEGAARILQRDHGIPSGDFYTAHLPLPGAPDEPWESFLAAAIARAAEVGLPARTAEHLARAYGTEMDAVLDRVRADPGQGAAIHPDLPYILAEIHHVVEHEMALTLEDVLRRRLHIFYEASDGGATVAPAVAARMADHPDLGWDQDEITRQLDRYIELVRESHAFPAA